MGSYVFRGRLCGALCSECQEPLAGVKVRLYRLRDNQDVTRLAVANPKETVALVSDEQVHAKSSALLGEFETDADGNFTATLDQKSGYRGEAFEVDVYCESVPGRRGDTPPKPLQLTVTTVQPQWRQRGDSLVAAWDYCLPSRFWCFIRALFDAWVICGRLTVCKTGAPAVGVRVLAFDRDWLADDALGSAITDADGKFRIDYSGADFRRGTWINVELFGGPDVYFRVETLSGTVLLDEPSSRGREADRENVGPCFCTKLCVEDAPVVREAWFTRVGDFSIYSDIDSATGLTVSAQPAGFPNAHGGPGFAFWGSPKLIGDCPTTHPIGGQPMRYRFVARNLSSPGPDIPITGPGLVVALKVGTRPVTWNFGSGVGTYPQDIWVVPTGGYSGALPAPFPTPPAGPPPGSWGAMPPLLLEPTSEGWVTMPPDATNQGFSGPLMQLSSAALAPSGAAPVAGAGNPILPAQQKNGVDFEIRFDAQPTSGPSATGPTLSNQLDRIHINNWLEVALLTVDQFTAPGASPCSPVLNALDIRYTVDHELMRSWSITLWTKSGVTVTWPGAGIGPLSPSEFLTPRGGFGVHHVDTSTWPNCAYGIVFNRSLKLTDGEHDDSGRGPLVEIFCKS